MQQIYVSDLIEQVRIMSGLRGNTFYTNANICTFMTDANQELHDEFQKANEHHLMSSFDFTLTGNGEGLGNSYVEVPEDFIQGHTVSGNMDQPEQSRFRVHTLPNWLQRHEFRYAFRPRYYIRGRILEMYPNSLAAGSYRLWYTARAEVLAEPVTRTFDISAADTVISGDPGQFAFANGEFGEYVPGQGAEEFVTEIPTDETATLTVDADAPNTGYNGTYFIQAISSQTLVTVNDPLLPGWSNPADGTVTLLYQPVGTVGKLKPTVVPYAEFIKLHASITIRHGQDLDASDLERKLERIRLQIKGNVQNKTEEPSQPPLEHDQAWDMVGSWGEPGTWG